MKGGKSDIPAGISGRVMDFLLKARDTYLDLLVLRFKGAVSCVPDTYGVLRWWSFWWL